MNRDNRNAIDSRDAASDPGPSSSEPAPANQHAPSNAESQAFAAARDGDLSGVGRLLEDYRDRLRRMIHLRMHPAMRGRVDASDILQEAFVEASTRLPDYLNERDMPFFVWVRFLTSQKLAQLHRRHLGAQVRDARRDRRIAGARDSVAASSVVLADALVAQYSSPSQGAARLEENHRIEEVLESMKEIDREILALRHYEHLSNAEAAAALGVTEATASVRYVRAAKRLRDALTSPEG